MSSTTDSHRVSLRSSIDKLFEQIDHPATILWTVFVLGALEATILPIPFELMLVPLLLRKRQLIWAIVLAALAGCMLGAFVGYAVGLFAFQSFGQPLLDWLGAGEGIGLFKQRLENNAFWTIFLVGFTPVPVQVATLGAGFMEISLAKYTLAMLLARALRFGALGFIVYLFGDATLRLIKRHRKSVLLASSLIVAMIVFLLFGPEGSQSVHSL